MIDAPCHCKQNGKYNLAFSLCGDNGANTRWQHRLEQTARLVIRQECFGTIWSAGWGGGGEKGGGGGGTTQSRGIELSGRSYAGVFSHSVRTGVICALGLLSEKTRPCSATLLMAYLSKPLSIELFNMTCFAEGNYLSLL